MYKLQELFLNALQGVGYGVIQAIELWNTIYRPEILELKPGKYTYYVGKYEITFTKTK